MLHPLHSGVTFMVPPVGDGSVTITASATDRDSVRPGQRLPGDHGLLEDFDAIEYYFLQPYCSKYPFLHLRGMVGYFQSNWNHVHSHNWVRIDWCMLGRLCLSIYELTILVFTFDWVVIWDKVWEKTSALIRLGLTTTTRHLPWLCTERGTSVPLISA